jgi:hypothetical protein
VTVPGKGRTIAVVTTDTARTAVAVPNLFLGFIGDSAAVRMVFTRT